MPERRPSTFRQRDDSEPLPVTATVAQFRKISGLGKTSIYELINSGGLASEFVNGQRLIRLASYMDLIRNASGAPTTRLKSKTRRWMAPRDGFVYFMGTDDGRVKIGYSTNPKKRLSGVQTGASSSLRLLAIFRGTLKDEDNLHRRFAGYRVRGEWFRLEGEFKDYLEALPHE